MTSRRSQLPLTRITLAAIAAAVLCSTVVVSYGVERSRFDAFELPKQALLHLAAALVAVAAPWRGRSLRLHLGDLALLAFLLLAGVSALRAANPYLAARSLALLVSGAVLFWAAAAIAARGGRRILLAVVTAAAGLAAASALAEVWFLAPMSLDQAFPGGLIGHRNYLAHMLVLAAPAAVWLGLTTRRRASLVLVGLAFAAIVAATVVTRCRTAWVAAFVSIGLAALLVWRSRSRPSPAARRRLWLLAAVAVVAIAVVTLAPNRLSWRHDAPYRDTLSRLLDHRSGSGRGRLIQYRDTLELVTGAPLLGVGPGNWPIHFPRVSSAPQRTFLLPSAPRSSWIGIWAECGSLALACLLSAGLLAANAAWRRWRDARSAGARGRSLAFLCAGCVLVVVGALDAPLMTASGVAMSAVVLGALVPRARPSKTLALRPALRRSPALVVPLLLAASLHAGVAAAAEAVSQDGSPEQLRRAARIYPQGLLYHRILALRATRTGDCQEVLRSAPRALALDPYADELAAGLARCRELASRRR